MFSFQNQNYTNIKVFFLEFKKLQKVTNHPVHLVDEDGRLSPTALVPFCEFGGNFSVMGIKIDEFDVPVCKSFRPKIIRDHLCYTVDPNDYKHKIDLKGELSLSLYIHYNEDRQMENSVSSEEPNIIVETLGKRADQSVQTSERGMLYLSPQLTK